MSVDDLKNGFFLYFRDFRFTMAHIRLTPSKLPIPPKEGDKVPPINIVNPLTGANLAHIPIVWSKLCDALPATADTCPTLTPGGSDPAEDRRRYCDAAALEALSLQAAYESQKKKECRIKEI